MIIKPANFHFAHNGRYGKGPILISIKIRGYKTMFLNTGIKVLREQWDRKSETILNHPDQHILNTRLEILRQNYKMFELRMLQDGKQMTLGDVQDFYQEQTREKAAYTLQGFIFHYARNVENAGTAGNYITLIKQLNRIFGNNIPFSSINYVFIQRLERRLKEDGLIKTSRYNVLTKLRKILTEAENYELIRKGQNPFNYFKPEKGPSRHKPYLTIEELRDIQLIKFTNSDDIIVRDKWFFSLYSGMRIGDVKSLKIEEIKIGPKSCTIEKVNQKGKKDMIKYMDLMFGGRGREIILKYYNASNIYLFPDHRSVAEKRVMQRFTAITKKHITWHTARHSLGHVVGEITGDPLIVKQILNHTNVETSMIYTHTRDKYFMDQLKNINL